MIPKHAHVLIPGICDYVTSHVKDFLEGIRTLNTIIRRLSGWVQYNGMGCEAEEEGRMVSDLMTEEAVAI